MKPTLRHLLLITALLASAALSWLPQLETLASERADAGLKRALITFATARTFNAVISTLQETTLSFQPMGIGLTLSPGQALDPINDLIEQFSTLRLAASVSFGAQKVLISIGSHSWVSALLTLATLGACWTLWRRRALPAWTRTILIGLLVLRFAVPLAILGSDMAFKHFLAPDYDASQQRMAGTVKELGSQAASAQSAANPSKESMLDKLKHAATLPDIRSYAESMQKMTDKAVSDVVLLIVTFLLQTLVFPLLLMWLLLRLVRLALHSEKVGISS